MNQTANAEKKKRSRFDRFLDGVERVGNKFPDPTILFMGLTLVVVLFSVIGDFGGWSVIHPSTGEVVKVFDLLSPAGIQYMFSNLYQNFVGFSPFAISISVFMVVGLMEESGFLKVSFLSMSAKANQRTVTAVICFVGIMSNAMGDIGFVMLPPLAAMLFMAMGRNPIVGMCCGYAAPACGLSANLLIGLTDARLSATSQMAAQIINPEFVVSPTCNWYFCAAATIVLTIAATFTTERILEPRMGKWNPANASDELSEEERMEGGLDNYKTTDLEKKGLHAAGWVSLLILVAIAVAATIPGGLLVNSKGVSLFAAQDTQIGCIVSTLLLIIAIPGVVYGKIVGTIKNGKDFGNCLAKGIRDIALFAVLCFFAGQFTAWFSKSNLGMLLAVSGTEGLKRIGLTGLPLMIILIIFFALVNLFIPSANAKYALMAPIFVPMLMLLGYHPALAQILYRIGDSTTNAITPVMAYFALMLALVKKYDKKAGMGTLQSLLMPYTLCYGVAWIALFVVWYLLGLPLGPSGPLFLS